jgi:hypothetical protein
VGLAAESTAGNDDDDDDASASDGGKVGTEDRVEDDDDDDETDDNCDDVDGMRHASRNRTAQSAGGVDSAVGSDVPATLRSVVVVVVVVVVVASGSLYAVGSSVPVATMAAAVPLHSMRWPMGSNGSACDGDDDEDDEDEDEDVEDCSAGRAVRAITRHCG